VNYSNLGLFFTVSEIRPLITWNFPLKIAAKSLQMETWYYWQPIRSRQPYPIIPSPTFYDLPFSHNTAQLAYHSALW